MQCEWLMNIEWSPRLNPGKNVGFQPIYLFNDGVLLDPVFCHGQAMILYWHATHIDYFVLARYTVHIDCSGTNLKMMISSFNGIQLKIDD